MITKSTNSLSRLWRSPSSMQVSLRLWGQIPVVHQLLGFKATDVLQTPYKPSANRVQTAAVYSNLPPYTYKSINISQSLDRQISSNIDYGCINIATNIAFITTMPNIQSYPLLSLKFSPQYCHLIIQVT